MALVIGCNGPEIETLVRADSVAPKKIAKHDEGLLALTASETRKAKLLANPPTGGGLKPLVFSDVVENDDGTITYYIDNDVRYHKVVRSEKGDAFYRGRRRGLRSDPLTPDTFNPHFEGTVEAKLSEVGNGPYTLGRPKSGYMSDYFKTAFSYYDEDTKFANSTDKSPICDFTKAALFSEEIDLSRFYWHHPDAGEVPLQKINNGTYRLTDSSELYISVEYEGHFIPSGDNRPQPISNFPSPMLQICDVADDPNLPLGEKNYPDIKKGLTKCDYEYNTDIDPVYPHDVRGITIGFFLYDGEIYTVSMRVMEYTSMSRMQFPQNVSEIDIITAKVSYNNIPEITKMTPVCLFQKHQDTD